jgi:hypothetical protein
MLSALSGRASYGVTKGDIFINGSKTTFSKWKKVVGFVPQEDVMVCARFRFSVFGLFVFGLVFVFVFLERF